MYRVVGTAQPVYKTPVKRDNNNVPVRVVKTANAKSRLVAVGPRVSKAVAVCRKASVLVRVAKTANVRYLLVARAVLVNEDNVPPRLAPNQP